MTDQSQTIGVVAPPTEKAMTFSTRLSGTVAHVALRGDLDRATGAECRRVLYTLLSFPLTRLVIDARELDFMDSYGLSVLDDARRRAAAHYIGIAIRSLHGTPLRVFTLTGAIDLFECVGLNRRVDRGVVQGSDRSVHLMAAPSL